MIVSLCTVLALKFLYYLDSKKVALSSISDDISILAYEKAKGDYYRLVGSHLLFRVYNLLY
jgi:hypothetical protein